MTVTCFNINNKTSINLPRLLETRLLIQANSGGGKSWALRKILEETAGQCQQLIIDPEGEFASLRSKFDMVICAPHDADAIANPRTAKLLARRLMENRVSAVLDIYDLKAHERQSFVKIFLETLVNLPKKLWHPALVILDEAHVFAPEKGKSESTGAVIDLATRGRKRGLCLAVATQRLAKLHKDVAAELLNKMVGRTGLDIDLRRAGEELGLTTREARTMLRDLKPGEFYVFGPAISRSVEKIKVGTIVTKHPKVGQRLMKAPPAPSAKIKQLLRNLEDLPKQAEEELVTLTDLRKEVSNLRRRLTQAGKQTPVSTVELVRVKKETVALKNQIKLAQDTHSILTRKLKQIGKILESKEGSITIKPPPLPVIINEKNILEKTNLVTDSITKVESTSQQRILDSLASLEVFGITNVPRATLAAHARFKPGTGHFNNLIGRLKTGGFIDYPDSGEVCLTKHGKGFSNYPSSPPTLDQLHASWLEVMPSQTHRKVLSILIEQYPDAVSREDLALESGLTPKVGHTNNVIGKLRTLQAATYPRKGYVQASSILFP